MELKGYLQGIKGRWAIGSVDKLNNRLHLNTDQHKPTALIIIKSIK